MSTRRIQAAKSEISEVIPSLADRNTVECELFISCGKYWDINQSQSQTQLIVLHGLYWFEAEPLNLFWCEPLQLCNWVRFA